ncbi:MAG: hypothetical protein IJJ38_02900 [Lachnospiraceae bacterium]|nr:hypothetical protein [Lachnospiraceae bacterium]
MSRKKCLVIAALLALCVCLLPVSVSAASAGSSKKYVKLYRKLLKKRRKKVTSGAYSYDFEFKSFLTLDVNRDGTPELVIKNQDADVSIAGVMVYTVKKGKLFYCGMFNSKTLYKGLSYSKKHKGIIDTWWTNGVGGSGAVLLRIPKRKHELVQKYKAWEGAAEYGGTKMVYQIGPSLRKTSKAGYKKYCNKYFNKKNIKARKFRANTASNRRKIK